MTLVKICGVRTPEQALLAATAGADLIGLVFYAPSHRALTVEEASAITTALRELGAPPLTVGLFVNESTTTIDEVARAARLDLVQLSGSEPSETLARLSWPLLRTVRISASEALAAVHTRLERDEAAAAHRPPGPLGQPVTFLLDAHIPGAYGGTGALADWEQAAQLASQFPLLLAGGLHPENVADAVEVVRPLGVDVSSGVETGRVKDGGKIRRFIEAVRDADARVASKRAPLAGRW